MGIVIKVYQMHQEGKAAIKVAETVNLSVAEVEEIIRNFA